MQFITYLEGEKKGKTEQVQNNEAFALIDSGKAILGKNKMVTTRKYADGFIRTRNVGKRKNISRNNE